MPGAAPTGLRHSVPPLQSDRGDPIGNCRDHVAQVMAFGGYPRSAVVRGKTVWLDLTGRPWRAGAEKARRRG